MRKVIIAIGLLLLLLIAPTIHAQTFEVGGGYLFKNQEIQTIDLSDVRGWFQLGGIELPLPGNTATGAQIEAGYTTATVWSLWNCNRTEMANVIAGADLQIARGGPVDGSSFNFDVRLVAGYRFTKNLAVYVHFLEDQTPVFVGMGWRF